MKRLALALSLGAFFLGCPKPPAAVVAAVDAGTAGPVVKELDDKADATKAGEDIVPVLEDKGPPDARAVRLCRATQGVIVERKTACCEPGKPAGATDVERACTSAVSAALKSKNVTIDEAALAACEQAQHKELGGDCAWVRALPPPLPKECTTLLTGTLTAGARCRSSLECAAGLKCHGASLLDAGRCGPSKPARAPCGASVDALAIAVGQPAIDKAHPECAGLCVLGRCADVAKAGAPCKAAAECGDGNRCEDGTCKAGLVALGQKCTGPACADGGRCADGTCRALSTTGGPCRDDFDCARGGCVKATAGAATGTCGMRCTSWRDLKP